MTARFSKIDDQNRADHVYLSAADECFYLYEYTSGTNYSYSATNNLISNLKKKPSLRSTNQWQHKVRAMQTCAIAFSEAINPLWLQGATLVPVPPSKVMTDPEYDDRMLQICRQIRGSPDVRELVVQGQSTTPFHTVTSHRPRVEDLVTIYSIDESRALPAPHRIGIVDDVLTNGTHFAAMKRVLAHRFPGIPIVGFFVTRRVFPKPPEGFDVSSLGL